MMRWIGADGDGAIFVVKLDGIVDQRLHDKAEQDTVLLKRDRWVNVVSDAELLGIDRVARCL